MMDDILEEENRQSAEPTSSTFIKIGEVNTISRARALRIVTDDVIIGIDGEIYKDGIIELKALLEECDEDLGVALTIWRAGTIFNVIAYGPLGATLEIASAEDAEAIGKDVSDYRFPKRDELTIFEVLRNLTRKCEIIDTTPSQTASIMPVVWLAQNRLFEPLLAILSIYAITFVVHWALFLVAYVVLALYFRRGSLMMLRSFIVYKEYQMWMVIAARDIKEVQEVCRRIDPKTQFRNSLVGDPVVEQPPIKKRRRSSIPGM